LTIGFMTDRAWPMTTRRLKTVLGGASASLLATALLAVAYPAGAAAEPVIVLDGSTASYPLVSKLTAAYSSLKQNKGKVKFKVGQGGTDVGVSDVAAGRVTLADVSREPLPSDPAGLVFYPIARYFVSVITNDSNHLANLTEAELKAIFTGRVRNWSQVPGATASGTIDLISRTATAGVLDSFETLLLGADTVSTLAQQESSEGQVQQQVASDPNAIGFVSDYYAFTGVHAVGFNGVVPSLATAESGQYQGVSRFYEVSKGRATGATAAFLGWVTSSAAARKIISSQWLPLS
jgi:phosphate transport system substrate-binding protein